MIKRYDCVTNDDNGHCGAFGEMIEDKDGDYVLLDDYLAKINELKESKENLIISVKAGVSQYQDEVNDHNATIEQLDKANEQLEVYEEALKFYADEEIYLCPEYDGGVGTSQVEKDKGAKAKAALGDGK